MEKNSVSIDDSRLQYPIWADSLLKKYRNAELPALNGLSLRVARGDFFGLIGPNGAGKTTAISIFCGLMRQDAGLVYILGRKLRQNDYLMKSRIGLVPQDIALFEKLTGRENLQYFARLYGLRGGKMYEAIAHSLQFIQLSGQADRLVETYSGGMKRRLNLAVGLLHQPEILFLDEPTVGIDAQSRQLIHEKLQELNSDGTTIIYTTHYMEEAQKLCSHVGIIDNGRVIRQGKTKDLTNAEGFNNLNDLFLSLTGKQLRDE